MTKGYGRGWHLKKHFEAPDGKIYSFGKEITGAKSKSQAKRLAVQKDKKATSKKKVASKPKNKPKAATTTRKTAKKKVEGKLVVQELKVWRVVYKENGKIVEIVSDYKEDRKDAESFLQRQYETYGENLAGAPFMIFRKVEKTKKRKGWVVTENDGTKHEFEGLSKKDAKDRYLRKIKETRLPRGTKIEKIE